MDITTEAAGLIAQVFPALIIALLLEGRHAVWRWWWLTQINLLIRLVAIMSASASTFACLLMVMTNSEVGGLNWVVAASWYLLAVSFMFMIAHQLIREVEVMKQQ